MLRSAVKFSDICRESKGQVSSLSSPRQTLSTCQMSLIAITSYYLVLKGVSASPIASGSIWPQGNISLFSKITVQDNLPNGDPGTQRSLLNIIWTCASTIFACTWLSVHPNIPGPDESWFEIARGRAKLMLYALVMPEVVICWAIRQRAASSVIANNFSTLFNVKWGIEHGFFAQMGGFMLYREDKVVCVLTPYGLESLLSRNLVDLPDITKEEIQDRSKGDLITKGIAILQSTWFVAQCISRILQHLSITQLELVTLGLAMLNGAMFAAWWKKPLDVHCSVRIQLKRQNNTPDWHALVSELHWMSPPPLSRTTSLMSNQEIEFQSVHAEEQEVAADNQEIELQSVNADEQEVAVGNQGK
ncbi:hypothetical protein BDQ12DRAFT_500825, partial [Crucibulum laeve]